LDSRAAIRRISIRIAAFLLGERKTRKEVTDQKHNIQFIEMSQQIIH